MISGFPFGLILDVIILLMLMATILYCVRLTGYLKSFKDSRSQLDAVIRDLSKNIDKADKALANLNLAVDESSYELKSRIDKAAKMGGELDMMVQTADALANRLEELAVRNRKIIDGGEGDAADLMRKTLDDGDKADKKQGRSGKKSPSMPAFNIRDPEVERGDVNDKDGFSLDDDDILSEAERDLYQKLNSRRG